MSYLNTNNLPSGYIVVAEIFDAFAKEEMFYLIKNAQEVIYLRKDKFISPAPSWHKEDEPGYSLEQFVVPLTSLPWLVDIIENKFWKKPGQGGAPADVLHYKNTFGGEDLKIRFTPNCQKEFEPGVTITNLLQAPRTF
ncbi:hypothetical protein [Thalassomonas actiniarum]|uniref:Uncharacterized protein n=1 Tax=Thalassomonas actiniarum TaxID=485447 RepID=A0AAE9YVN8_9GAMM|nr:hypothetical protein [Thalassomonas actiniarum]WDE01194.1 hypothetical protein SG35_011450 [Thalassomonas actiniarum]